jgi:hypothetical protein
MMGKGRSRPSRLAVRARWLRARLLRRRLLMLNLPDPLAPKCALKFPATYRGLGANLAPFTHTCVDQPQLECSACIWSEESAARVRERRA